MSNEIVQKELPIPAGVYRIKNKGTQKYLALTPTGGVLTKDVADDDSQKWTATKSGTADKSRGVYSFFNLGDQRFRLGYRAEKDKGPDIGAKVAAKEDLIQWAIWKYGSTTFTIGIETTKSTLLMENEKGSTRVSLREESAEPEQEWELVLVNQASIGGSSRPIRNTVASGRKYFIRNWHGTLLLTIGSNPNDGKVTDGVFSATQIQTKLDLKATQGQIWSLNVKNNGRVELYNITLRRYIATATGKDAAYQELTSSIDPYEWYVNSVGGYAWTITSPTTGLAIGHLKPKPTTGDPVCLMSHIASQNQIWFFEELDDSTVVDPIVLVPEQKPTPAPEPTPPGGEQKPTQTPKPTPTPGPQQPPTPAPEPTPPPPEQKPVPVPKPPAPTPGPEQKPPPTTPAPEATPTKPSVAFNQSVPVGSFVIRNKSTDMTLAASYNLMLNSDTLVCGRPGYPTMFTLSQKGSSEYNIFSDTLKQYASASQDQVLPNPAAYGWVFASASPGYVYISPAQTISTRKVIQCGEEEEAPLLVDFKAGDEMQMWKFGS